MHLKFAKLYIIAFNILNKDLLFIMELSLIVKRPIFLIGVSPPNSVVTREAGCCTKGSGFKSQVRHGCQTVRPWLHQWLRSKTGRQEVPGSFLGRACRRSRSELSMVFSETCINTG